MDDYLKVALISDFKETDRKVVKGDHCPVLLYKQGETYFAVDNRCPHMGFPLDKGTVHDGILTCHWHHARFDISSGCTFNLFADDTPSYKVKVEKEAIWVSKQPSVIHDFDFHLNRLHEGLAQNVSIVLVKSIIGLLNYNKGLKAIICALGEYGVKHQVEWSQGLTLLTAIANIEESLSSETKAYALSFAAQMIASDCSGQPAPRRKASLSGNQVSDDQLMSWMEHWVLTRQEEGAERTLATAIERGSPLPFLNELLLGSVQQRIYADGGHSFDFINKAFELTGILGDEKLLEILPSTIKATVRTFGEEDSGAWRAPIDLIPLIRNEEKLLSAKILKIGNNENSDDKLFELFLGEDPQLILSRISGIITSGVDPFFVAQHLAFAAAIRLVRFPESNELGDWFSPVHTFIYCNALSQALSRSHSPMIVRGLYHGAMSVFVDRFLNIPSAKLPTFDSNGNKTEPELLAEMKEVLNHKESWNALPQVIVQYMGHGFDEQRLIDKMVFVTVREDLDFHKMQVLEASIQQAKSWPHDAESRTTLYVAAMRHLAAHCPTNRNQSKLVKIGMRLGANEDVHIGE